MFEHPVRVRLGDLTLIKLLSLRICHFHDDEQPKSLFAMPALISRPLVLTRKVG